jgi:hypothetical protein
MDRSGTEPTRDSEDIIDIDSMDMADTTLLEEVRIAASLWEMCQRWQQRQVEEVRGGDDKALIPAQEKVRARDAAATAKPRCPRWQVPAG